ncbi:MAG: hypothetical protein ABI999_01245 [Acidobacteriota bacterium]
MKLFLGERYMPHSTALFGVGQERYSRHHEKDPCSWLGRCGKIDVREATRRGFRIEVIHLDRFFWKPNWVETPKEEWHRAIENLTAGDSWIVDGNYGGTREMRIRACDTVIFLDISRRVCMYRILKRSLTYRGKTRPDMAEGCVEKFDFEFIRWVWNYPNRGRLEILDQRSHFGNKNFIVLSSSHALESFLATVS